MGDSTNRSAKVHTREDSTGKNRFASIIINTLITPAKMLMLICVLVAASANATYSVFMVTSSLEAMQKNSIRHEDAINMLEIALQAYAIQINTLELQQSNDVDRDNLIQAQNDKDHTEILRVLRAVEARVARI